MANVKVKKSTPGRLSQGDLFRDVEYIEYVTEKRGILEVSKIVFPLVVVLTQDCDLEQDARYRGRPTTSPAMPAVQPPRTQDKKLFSVLVAPLYNAEHVFLGQHLDGLGLTMAPINRKKTEGQTLMRNDRPRYHYLDFPRGVPLTTSIVDFKHYFSVSVTYLTRIRSRQYICRLSELYREDLSHRFAGYLARIGLPEMMTNEEGQNPQAS